MLFDDRRRAESFGSQAERYDRSRPSYPTALIDAVLAPSPDGLSVLDVGCGTGIASRLMAARGAAVLGVEVDARMAAVAEHRGTPVEVASFESWVAGDRTFDRVTSAQAWHWVDPVAGPLKAASVLRPGGRLCLFWNLGHPSNDLAAELDQIYAQLAPGVESYSVLLGQMRGQAGDPNFGYGAEVQGIAACPSLSEPSLEWFGWSRRYTRDEWLDQLPTHSDHAALAPDHRARLLAEVARVIDQAGGEFDMSYSTLLISATRI